MSEPEFSSRTAQATLFPIVGVLVMGTACIEVVFFSGRWLTAIALIGVAYIIGTIGIIQIRSWRVAVLWLPLYLSHFGQIVFSDISGGETNE